MMIRHFGGIETAFTSGELRGVLSKRLWKDVNEFWITEDNKEFPCMAILVNGILANVTFFEDENDIGVQSIGGELGLKAGLFTVFYTNTPNEEIEIHNEMIVSTEVAVKAAEAFLRGNTRPSCINWVKN